jgi:hypothetical protein
MNLTPDYTTDGGWGVFSDSDITYTVIDTLGHTWDSGTGYTVNVNDGPYSDGTTYNFTQIFKMDGIVKGSQVIRIRVSYGGFVTLRDAADNNTGASTIPPMTFTLTKKVTEGAITPETEIRYLTTAPSTFTAGLSIEFVVPTFNNVAEMWSGFNVNDITWTLTCSLGKDLSTYAENKQAIPATVYTDGDEPTITQVFSYKGSIVGQREIFTQKDLTSFTGVMVDGNTPNVIPALSLPISK